MEALGRTILPSTSAEAYSPLHRSLAPPLLRPYRLRQSHCSRVESFEILRLNAQRCGCKVRSVDKEVNGGNTAEEGVLAMGMIAAAGQDEAPSPIELEMSRNGSAARRLDHDLSMGGNGGGSRAGLFRTPISGGVQSATSAHRLPHPALAVRNLMEQARFAHLCTTMSRMHHRREGYPFGSLVDFATDAIGHPIFSLSPLAIHTRNLLADPRCTLVVQIPGWSGLSNARVTIFGDVYPLSDDEQEWGHRQYTAKHQQWTSQQWGNFYYYRMQNISDIYFIGGFGTVAWVNVKDYEALRPDKIAVDGGERNLKELNAIFSKPLRKVLSLEGEIDDVALISIDSKGVDIRVRQGLRISFEEDNEVETVEDATAALQKIINRVYRVKPQKRT